MKFKPITAIAVLLLVVASLLVSGCLQPEVTLSPANQATTTNQASKTSPHGLVQALLDNDGEMSSYRPRVSVEWLNDTTAHEHFVRNDGDSIMTTDITYAAFPNTAAASTYFDSLRSKYPIKPTHSITHRVYLNLVTGNQPTVIKGLETYDSNHYLAQEDTVVEQESFQFQYINQA